MRQIVLDTETTGLEHAQGHRVIEIGGVELIDRRLTGRRFHCYVNPEREVEPGAFEVHGIGNEFLADKPLFAQIAHELLEFVRGAELIIHNAPFDIGFLDNELTLQGGQHGRITDHCRVIDTLALARQRHPGQKNSLDALCKRYAVDNSQRELHGALLDAEILADVYLRMTGGQTLLALDGHGEGATPGVDESVRRIDPHHPRTPVLHATAEELVRHRERLAAIDRASGGKCQWREEQPA